VAITVAEESPPTHRARSRTQVRVARVTAMAQKRHGLFSVMKRSRRFTVKCTQHVWKLAERQQTGIGETANPCGCKSEQDYWIARYLSGYDA